MEGSRRWGGIKDSAIPLRCRCQATLGELNDVCQIPRKKLCQIIRKVTVRSLSSIEIKRATDFRSESFLYLCPSIDQLAPDSRSRLGSRRTERGHFRDRVRLA